MVEPAREVESKALELPQKERARLAERLISSLDQESDAEAEKLWLDEAERRLDEIESARVTSIEADKVARRVRSALR